MDKSRRRKLTDAPRRCPGPANGYTLDMILAWRGSATLLDWAMIILNPLEPWPVHYVLPSAVKHNVI